MIPSTIWLLVIAMAVCRISCVGSASANNINAHLIRAPSVFPPESSDMHRYSAILAATEPFRRLCNDQIKRSLNPITRIVKTLMGKSLLQQGVEERRTNIPVDVALTRFEMRVQSIAGSYGMTVDGFNQLTQSLNQEPALKKKIFLQSYFYKIAADLEANINKVLKLPCLPAFDEGSIEQENKYSYAVIDPSLTEERYCPSRTSLIASDAPSVTRLATALVHIESERLKLREKIRNALNIEDLPPNIADPRKLPAFAEPIQQANKEFPKIAVKIVADCGFPLEEFIELREKVIKDLLFRQKVINEISHLRKT